MSTSPAPHIETDDRSRAGASSRALHRHAVVGATSIALVALVMFVTEFSSETWGSDHKKSHGSLWQFNVATGTVALLLVVGTLVYRPVRVLRGRRPGPVHFPWRRTIGIWAAIAVVAHVPGGIAIHTTGWRFWTPFESVFPWVDGRPFDAFTIGYWAGVVAVVAIVPLVLTSRDAALRRLGARSWQRRHRIWIWTTYWVLALHVVALQYAESRILRHIAVSAAIFATALAARLLARRARNRAVPRAPDATSPAV